MEHRSNRDKLREAADLITAGNQKAAQDVLREVLRQDPDNPQALYLAHFLMESQAQKIRVLEKVLAQQPDHVAAIKALNQLRRETNPFEELLSNQTPAKPMHREPLIWVALGLVLLILCASAGVLGYPLLSGMMVRIEATPTLFVAETMPSLEPSVTSTLLIPTEVTVQPTITPSQSPTPTLTATPRPTATPTATSTPTSTPVGNLPVSPLDYSVADAEYSQRLNRIVAISSSPLDPNQVHIIDPETYTEQVINLNDRPTSVGVSPDGLYAVIGHPHKLSYVDISAATIIKTLDVNANTTDVVLAGNGWIYVSQYDTWEQLRRVNIQSGVDQETGDETVVGGSVIRLHPSGNRLYLATVGVSPSSLSRFDMVGDALEIAYYDFRDYEICGNFWFSLNGARVYTACGIVLSLSSVVSDDFAYYGTFEQTEGQLLASSDAPGCACTIGATARRRIQVWNRETLKVISSKELGSYPFDGEERIFGGRYIFVNQNTARVYLLVQGESDELYQDRLPYWGLISAPLADFLQQ